MNALVGYDSSDEDEDVETAGHEVKVVTRNSNYAVLSGHGVQTSQSASAAPFGGPTAGPSLPARELEEEMVKDTDTSSQLSPYSANREQMQALTMPRFPVFNIPRSPSPPPANSEEATALTARTRKFERFLELKKQGVHFNDRLASSSALRNPDLLQKLAEFAGISPEEQYENTLSDAFAVPTRWQDGFLESLVASNEKMRKKEKESRSKLDFVPASSKTSG